MVVGEAFGDFQLRAQCGELFLKALGARDAGGGGDVFPGEKIYAALVQDLKQRGLLDSTLVVWGGEYGRTPMNEARDGSKFLGRDHHPHAFSIWMAGGGVKPGLVFGATDDFGYQIAQDKVTVRDLQATIMHLMGFDPYHFAYRYQGLNQRLIGPTNEGQIVKGILA